jgi:hypothetical protein
MEIDLDEELTPEQIALGTLGAERLMSIHQVLEWELVVHPAGVAWMRSSLSSQVPAVLAQPVSFLMRQQLGKQLCARDIARHAPKVIAQSRTLIRLSQSAPPSNL